MNIQIQKVSHGIRIFSFSLKWYDLTALGCNSLKQKLVELAGGLLRQTRSCLHTPQTLLLFTLGPATYLNYLPQSLH